MGSDHMVGNTEFDKSLGKASLPASGLAIPTLMLVAVTLLWGASFPLMKNWQEMARDYPGITAFAGFTMIFLRMILAVAVMVVMHPRLVIIPRRREHQIGLLLGAIFFLGFSFQVMGLASTSPAMSAFITSLGSAWVPLIAWIWLRTSIPRLTWFGIAVGIAGTLILTMGNIPTEQQTWGIGEGLTILASILFAVQILVLDRLGQTIQSAHVTISFFGINAVLALLMAVICAACGEGLESWWNWTVQMVYKPENVRDLLFLSVFSTYLAFHWMNTYQPRVTAARAALIYLLEPVFGTAFSICLGYDVITTYLVLGGCLILGGNLLVEMPNWLGKNQQANMEQEKPTG